MSCTLTGVLGISQPVVEEEPLTEEIARCRRARLEVSLEERETMFAVSIIRSKRALRPSVLRRLEDLTTLPKERESGG